MAKETTPEEVFEQATRDLKDSERELGRLAIEELGYAVIAWSHAERNSEWTLSILLLGCGMPLDDARLVSTTIDLRDRAALIIALGYRKVGKKRWFGELVSVTNRLSNELRNSRNRIFHDIWSEKRGRLIRRSTSKLKLTRPQSRKFELLVPEFEPVTSGELGKFIGDCLALADQLDELNDRLLAHFDPRRRG